MERSLSAPVFRCDPLPAGAQLTLTGAEGHHGADVRRLRPGERVSVTDGRGGWIEGPVLAVDRGRLSVGVELRGRQPPPQPRLVVAQALPKGERGELAVELLTEVGADEIVPWRARRCVTRWDDARAERSVARWQATAVAAAKQSRRVWFPEVSAPVGTAELAARVAGAALAVVLHERAAQRLAGLALPAAGEVVVVVGPEGGLSDEELVAFAVGPVRLGDAVLRTSTAGAVALAVLLGGGRTGG